MIDNRRLSRQVQAAVSTSCVTRGADTVVMRVMGDVDIATVSVVDLDVRRVCRSAPAALVVDLSGVTFLGAAGLTLLLETSRQAELAGTALSLVAPPGIERLLRITGLTPAFRVHSTASDALAAGPAPPARRSKMDIRSRLFRLVKK